MIERIGRLAGLDLQVGAAPGRLGQRLQVLVGEADAAVGAAAIDAEIISGHLRPPECRCLAARRGRTIMPRSTQTKGE